MRTKKLFFSVLALAGMLFANSCTQEDIVGGVSGDFVSATFTLSTADGLATRTAIGDGTTVDEVACAVYDANGNELEDLRQYVKVEGRTATYSIRLAKGLNYRVAFFAYNKAAAAYDVTDLKNIVVKSGQLSNLESRDAFTGYYDVKKGETMNTITTTVDLRRPFAQLNLGIDATELKAAADAGAVVEKSYIKVSNVYNAFSAYDNAVVATDAAEEMEFAMNTIPAEALTVGEATYTYLAMNYLLVGDENAEKSLTDVTFVWEDENGVKNDPAISFINIPVQRNYRTNITGRLLTSPADFTITIDAAFKGEYPVYTNIEVSSEEDLITALNNVCDGGTIHLTEDIKLANTLSTPAGKTITIDFAGKDFSVDSPTTTYAIRNLGTLILKDSKPSQKSSRAYSARGIYNGYAEDGTIVPEAKIIVESGEYNALGTDGGAAIFNYGIAEIKGGTFTSIGGYSLNNQSGAKMTIYEGVSANNGIYNNAAELVINGGEIKGNRSGCHVIYAWNSNVTINGGTIHNNNSGNSTLMAAGTSTMTVNGGTFTINIVDAASSYLVDAQNSATYNITGGSFTGGVRAQSGTRYEISGGTFANEYGNYHVNGSASISISGGTFVGGYAQQFANKYCAEGYKAIEANGKYVIFPESVGGYATTEILNKEGVTYTGDFFENSIANALYFKNWILEGDATIKVDGITYGAIILENVKGNLNGDAIVINNDNNSVMILANCDFTLAEGKKLIKSTNTIYQVFMTDITINGVKLTQDNAAQYLENVGWFQVVEEI